MIKFKKHLSLLFLLTFLTNITILKSNTYLKKITYGTAAGVLTYNITPRFCGKFFADYFGELTYLSVDEVKECFDYDTSNFGYKKNVPKRQQLEYLQYILGATSAIATYKLTSLLYYKQTT